MRGAHRSIANIWAVASRIKGYYGKRDLQTGERHDGPGGAGAGSRMEPAKSEIRFSEVHAPGGLRLRETGFLFQGLQDWEGVGETLTTGDWGRGGGAFHGGHVADGGFPCLLIPTELLGKFYLTPSYR